MNNTLTVRARKDNFANKIIRAWRDCKRREIKMLKNKCIFISIFNAMAYQYPSMLKSRGINSPLDLVKTMLFGEGSSWKNDCEWWADVHENTVSGRIGKKGNGNQILFPITCSFLKTNYSFDQSPLSDNVKTFLRIKFKHNEFYPRLLNICLVHGGTHAEFQPFPFVRTKDNQELYELYSKRSKQQIEAFEREDLYQEEVKAKEQFDLLCMGSDSDDDVFFEAFMQDMKRLDENVHD